MTPETKLLIVAIVWGLCFVTNLVAGITLIRKGGSLELGTVYKFLVLGVLLAPVGTFLVVVCIIDITSRKTVWRRK